MVWERIEVSRSLIFAVGNESAKTAKIKRLENLALYGSSEARPSRAYPVNIASKGEDFDKVLKFALCCIGKGNFTLKAEQLDAIKCIHNG